MEACASAHYAFFIEYQFTGIFLHNIIFTRGSFNIDESLGTLAGAFYAAWRARSTTTRCTPCCAHIFGSYHAAPHITHTRYGAEKSAVLCVASSAEIYAATHSHAICGESAAIYDARGMAFF